MKLTKQDLMRLPKERLAEIIVEMQNEPKDLTLPITTPNTIPYYKVCFLAPNARCDYGGMCDSCPHNTVTCYPEANTASGISNSNVTDDKEHPVIV